MERGRKIEFTDRAERRQAVTSFKKVVNEFGFVPRLSGCDVDHVVELQVGG